MRYSIEAYPSGAKVTRRIMILSLIMILCPALHSVSNADASGSSSPTALVVQGLGTGNTELAGMLEKEITSAGYRASIGSLDSLMEPDKAYDLIVLCDASALPLGSFDRFQQHFRKGGDIIALNAPMWRSALVRSNDSWVDRDDYLTRSAFGLPGTKLFDFSAQKPDGWQREAAKSDVISTWNTEKEQSSGRTVLRMGISDLQGMEFLSSPPIAKAFPKGNSLTIFSAKGGVRTSQLAVRWEESDGSRWTSVVPISGKWRQYILRPEDFKWSGGTPARKDAGFSPQNASRIAFGLSWADTGQVTGSHEYWLDGVSTEVDSDAYKQLSGGSVTPPDFDTLSPAYKLFDMSGVGKLTAYPGQSLVKAEGLPVPASLMSPHQRPQGNGFDKGREWRWVPILQAATSSGEWRGTPATLMVYGNGGFTGSAWASFGVQDKSWYRDPGVIKLIGDLARRMLNGAFIMDGGADLYTYTDKQPVRVGLRTANIGRTARRNLTATITVKDASSGKTAFTKSWQVDAPASGEQTVEETWTPKSWPRKGYTVSAELYDNGALLDSVGHVINLWKPKERPSFMSVKDGEFILNGKPWRANGVNYHPSSTVATWDWGLFLEWFGKRSYDPEVIDRDLRHIKEMGLNAVSIQIFPGTPLKTDNLLDFLRRLDTYGIKANLAIPLAPMTDLDKRWPLYRDVIERLKLKDVDTIIAYDIDWEPTWLTTEYRRQWDKEWAAWIVERYGSIESAEKDWGVPVPRDPAGGITNPPVQQTQSDGAWRRMSSAYRRFLGTLLYRQYSTARRMIKEVDPNHPVSFRMHAAGDGGSGWYGLLPYDWSYLAAGVDFFSPEAYTLGKSWETGIKRGLFTRAYAKWADPKKPMVYAEAGFNLLEYPGELVRREGGLERQATFYGDFYRMMNEGAVSGVFWWWYPGGFRCMENSDYGIINPDGSDRPVTALIRDQAKGFGKPSPLKQGDRLMVDPDAYISSSEAGNMYDQTKDKFWAEIGRGSIPVLDSPGRGTDSSNCPMTAVGNAPGNGSAPPRYLDASFDTVEILRPDGVWRAVKKNEELTLDTGKPVYMRVRATNLGDAKWLAGTAAGCVSVVIAGGAPASIGLPVDAPHLGSVDLGPYIILPAGSHERRTITLRMDARARAPFGDVFSFTVTGK